MGAWLLLVSLKMLSRRSRGRYRTLAALMLGEVSTWLVPLLCVSPVPCRRKATDCGGVPCSHCPPESLLMGALGP